MTFRFSIYPSGTQYSVTTADTPGLGDELGDRQK